MSKSKRVRKTVAASEALAVLARLADEGTYAVLAGPRDGSADTYCVYAPCNGSVQPVAEASRSAIAQALRKGWITTDACGTRVRVSVAGLSALRAGADNMRARPAARSGRGKAAAVSRPDARSTLGWMLRRRDREGRPLVSQVQLNAAEKLAADFWHAHMLPRVTANWSAIAPGRRMRRATPGIGVEARDSVIAARQRFQRALDAVGPELAGILFDVCCQNMGLEASGQAAGWPQRAAKVVLDLALTRLARHYGMLPPEHPVATRMRHWGDPDYRPTLEAWR